MYFRPPQSARPRILVLEGDAAVFDRVCGLLRANGYHAFGGDAAQAACSMLRRKRVDLVLTDAPEADRSEWKAALGALDPRVPVVAMCNRPQLLALDLFDLANELGASAVLPKPFSAAVLLSTIAGLLPATPAQSAAESLAASFEWHGLEPETTRH